MTRLPYLLVLALVLTIAAIVGVYYLASPNFFNGTGRGCTLEAKQCPNGTYVGRTGPNCEFTPCPEKQMSTDSWKSYTDAAQHLEVFYPETLPATYIQTVPIGWPPKVTIEPRAYSCEQKGGGDGLPQEVVERTANGRSYCVSVVKQGAAGSVYADYVYSKKKGLDLVSISFALRYPQCGNYDEMERAKCTKEQTTFDLDGIALQILKSIRRE